MQGCVGGEFVMATMNCIYSVDNPKNFMKVYEYCGHKFRINCTHRNGNPVGFNTNCCVHIMKPDGDWGRLEDNYSLNTKWKNLYYCDDVVKIKTENDRVLKAFLEYIKRVYTTSDVVNTESK
jgi:hypothetical protein